VLIRRRRVSAQFAGPSLEKRPRLHCCPISAGAIVAAAASFVLLSFGSGMRLAVVSPSSRRAASLFWKTDIFLPKGQLRFILRKRIDRPEADVSELERTAAANVVTRKWPPELAVTY
jgi:hypothetical protein